MNPLRILLLGDDSQRKDEWIELFRRAGHETAVSSQSTPAGSIEPADFDAIVIDLAWPELDLTALRRALSPRQEPDSLAAAERRHLALALRYTDGNKRKAAHLLGISRSTLLNKVRKYHLQPDTPNAD
jgi:DNA-binding NtrC family response regulator